jgi:hypothetical protein
MKDYLQLTDEQVLQIVRKWNKDQPIVFKCGEMTLDDYIEMEMDVIRLCNL